MNTTVDDLNELIRQLRSKKLDIELQLAAIEQTLMLMGAKATVTKVKKQLKAKAIPKKLEAAQRKRKVDRKFRESTLAFVKQKTRVGIQDLAGAFNITHNAAWWRLEVLVEEGKLKRYGNDLNGKSTYVEA